MLYLLAPTVPIIKQILPWVTFTGAKMFPKISTPKFLLELARSECIMYIMFDTQFFLFIFSQSEFYSKSSVYFVRRQYDMTEKIRIVPDLAKQKNYFFIIKKMGIFSRPSAGKRGKM